jgi:two-component system phosphate regulon response regulator OmpR
MLELNKPILNKNNRFNEFLHILVVDDDSRIRSLLSRFLITEGYRVSVAANVIEADEAMNDFIFDLIILDVMMPGENGTSFAQRIKLNTYNENITPILMLTALGETENRIAGLTAGADDYLAKPFDPRELLLRVANILKRVRLNLNYSKNVNFGSFFFNMETGQLYQDGENVLLTLRERDMLKILIANANKCVSRTDLAQISNRSVMFERSIDVEIARLRRKIEKDPRLPQYLKTIRGQGYKLNIEDQQTNNL